MAALDPRQVLEADVHLELLLPCNMLDSADLLPLHMQLPTLSDAAAVDGHVGADGRPNVPSGRRRREELGQGASTDAARGRPDR